MNSSDYYRPFGAVVGELRRLLVRAETGTLFIVTENNHFASIAIHNGTIIHVTYRNKRNRDAIALLGAIESCKASFQSTLPRKQYPGELPGNEEIVAQLGFEADIPNRAPSEVGNLITDSEIEVLQATLMDYLGPAAQLVLSEGLERIAVPMPLVRLLAEEIPDTAEGARFIVEASTRLGISRI